ncbi:MFS transporter [Saccharibacillus sacchari]|uniref:MFS transporter n=1 Tax=Saccharibacillus sacchari TaxID=456493 RepID=A0ACC6P8S6_9BACL
MEKANKVKGSIFFSIFVAMLGLMLIAPIMPPLIRELGLKAGHSGLIISLGSIMMAVMAPVWGKLSDKLGRKPVILAGFAGMTIACALFAAALYAGLQGVIQGGLLLGALIVTRSLIGGFIPAVLSSCQAYMGDITEGEERTKGMALISAANGLGLVFGPAIAGAFTLVGLLWPLYFGIVVSAVAFVIAWMSIPAARPVYRTETTEKLRLKNSGMTSYLFAGMGVMMAIVTLQVVGGFYFQDILDLSSGATARTVSFGLMAAGIAMLLVQVFQMKKLTWPPRRMIAVGAIFAVVGLLMFLLPGGLPLYYAAFFVFGAGAGLLMPGFMAGASLAAGAGKQGGAAGWVASMQGIAAIIAPLLMTGLYSVNLRIPFALSALLIAVSAAVLGLSRPDKKVALPEAEAS